MTDEKDGFSPDELNNEQEQMAAEYEEDAVKHQELMDRAGSWAAGEGLIMEQAGYSYEQATLMMQMRHERILLEILNELRKANGNI